MNCDLTPGSFLLVFQGDPGSPGPQGPPGAPGHMVSISNVL